MPRPTRSRLSRRRFIQSATVAGFAPFVVSRGISGAEGKFPTALIGTGWWGKNILKEAMASGRVKVAALCDADANTLEVAGEQVRDLSRDQPKLYRDFRELLDKEKPRIVIIATPDHWHAIQTIAAVKAGAHVFVEKPTGHCVEESRQMVKAARGSGVIVQVGLHRRTGPHHVSAMNFLKSGALGKVGMVRLFAYENGGREAASPNSPAPEGLDWDLWCGPAQLRPFNTKIHPGGWRHFLDYGNGTLGDWGVHWLDQVLWWTDEKYPRRIYSTGGRPVKGPAILNEREQTTDSPDHQAAVYDFEDFTCIWEHRRFGGGRAEKHQIGAYFYGAKGTLHIGWRDGWTFYPTDGNEQPRHEPSQLQEPDGHNIALLWANFIQAIDAGTAPVSGLETAHRASVLPLLGMISWKVGRSLTWDGQKEQIVGDPEASKLLSPVFRHPWALPG